MRSLACSLAVLIAFCALAAHALAQSTTPAPVSPSESPAGKSARTAPDKKKQRTELDVRGRVFMRSILSRPAARGAMESPGWSHRLALDSARLGARYRDRDLDLRVEVEAEIADDGAELRDAYIRLEPRSWLRVEVGRFKKPMSAVRLTSRWDLPAVERGLLDDFQLSNELTAEPDRLPVGDRGTGVQVEVRSEKPWEPRLTLGVFRSRVHAQLEEALGDNRVPLSLSQGFPEDIYGRVELEPGDDVHLGVSLAWIGMLGTAGTRDTFKHGYVAGLDLEVEASPLRLWLEGFVGDSPVHLGTALLARGQFAAGRAIIAAQVPLWPEMFQYIEPYAMAQYLDASSEADQDTAVELAGGVNLGFSKSWRLQLGAYHRAMDARLPGAGARVITQLGAVF